MKKEIEINWSIFKNVLSLNPALIFNSQNFEEFMIQKINQKNSQNDNYELENDEDLDDEENGEFKYFAEFEQIGSLNELHNLNSIFEIDKEDDVSDSFIQIRYDNYLNYKKNAINFLIKQKQYSSLEIEYISLTSKKDSKFITTLNFINNSDKKLLIDPYVAWTFDQDQEIKINYGLGSLALEKTKNGLVLYFLSYSTKSKFELYYKSFYAYNLFKNNGIELYDIQTIVIDPVFKHYAEIKKNELEFNFSRAASKTTSAFKNGKNTNVDEKLLSVLSGLRQCGIIESLIGSYALNSGKMDAVFCDVSTIDEINKTSFITVAKTRNFANNTLSLEKEILQVYKTNDQDILKLSNKLKNDQDLKIPFKLTYKKEIMDIKPFTWYNKLVLSSYKRYGNSVNINDIKYFAQFNPSIEEDYNDLIQILDKFIENNLVIHNIDNDSNFYIDKLNKDGKNIKNLVFENELGEEFKILAGGYYSKQAKNNVLLWNKANKDFFNKEEYFNVNTLNLIKELHIKDAKICWYDYEGFSDIFPVLDGVPAYNQVVNQVSIIVTQNGNEILKENIVLDPKTMDLKDLVQMLFKIASDNNYFVVYNKNYENTRNKEIAKLVRQKCLQNDQKFINWFLNYTKQETINAAIIYFEINTLNKINNNTIDLADIFAKRDPLTTKAEVLDNVKILNFNNSEVITKNVAQNDLESFISKNGFGSKIKELKFINIHFLKHFYSIKKIENLITESGFLLKTLITPYKDLVIKKGTMAMLEAQNRFYGATSDIIWENNIVPELKKYCENDVKAMIMVYEFIMFIARMCFSNIDDFEYQLDKENIQNIKYVAKNDKITIESVSN
ncbi:UU173 family protein [Mycoplasma leonicaptivi]|uniref:UU173 family protein n=1 Tax=Mycoplasma leonicaptivi TaxID=36742 RepID=UPI0004849E8F|nr:DUF2779 domain-containing protein [Mycoplasma leonicaptivi]